MGKKKTAQKNVGKKSMERDEQKVQQDFDAGKEAVRDVIAMMRVAAEMTLLGMRDYLTALREAQLNIKGYEVIDDIETLGMPRSARFKLIKCFANHREVDRNMAEFAFAAVRVAKCGKLI